jgi:hypothetical protein
MTGNVAITVVYKTFSNCVERRAKQCVDCFWPEEFLTSMRRCSSPPGHGESLIASSGRTIFIRVQTRCLDVKGAALPRK